MENLTDRPFPFKNNKFSPALYNDIRNNELFKHNNTDVGVKFKIRDNGLGTEILNKIRKDIHILKRSVRTLQKDRTKTDKTKTDKTKTDKTKTDKKRKKKEKKNKNIKSDDGVTNSDTCDCRGRGKSCECINKQLKRKKRTHRKKSRDSWSDILFDEEWR